MKKLVLYSPGQRKNQVGSNPTKAIVAVLRILKNMKIYNLQLNAVPIYQKVDTTKIENLEKAMEDRNKLTVTVECDMKAVAEIIAFVTEMVGPEKNEAKPEKEKA